jgi:ribitol-5-phosphate 2-dehydrogenase
VIDAMSKNEDYQKTLRTLLPSEKTIVSSGQDMVTAFNKILKDKAWNKALLEFKW